MPADARRSSTWLASSSQMASGAPTSVRDASSEVTRGVSTLPEACVSCRREQTSPLDCDGGTGRRVQHRDVCRAPSAPVARLPGSQPPSGSPARLMPSSSRARTAMTAGFDVRFNIAT